MFCFTATAQLVAWAHTHAHTFYTCTHTHILIPVSIRLWLTGNQGHLQWCHSFFLRQLQSPNTNTERKEKEENWGDGNWWLSVHWGKLLHGTYIQIDMECGRIDTVMDLITFHPPCVLNLTGCMQDLADCSSEHKAFSKLRHIQQIVICQFDTKVFHMEA